MKKRFVTFFSPGTIVSEMTTKEVPSWDVKKATEMMKTITERHGAHPYAFQFYTMKRGLRDMNPHEVDRSPHYYVNCKVQTMEDVEAEGPASNTLAQNMRSNNWERVVTTIDGYKWTQPFRDGDVVL